MWWSPIVKSCQSSFFIWLIDILWFPKKAPSFHQKQRITSKKDIWKGLRSISEYYSRKVLHFISVFTFLFKKGEIYEKCFKSLFLMSAYLLHDLFSLLCLLKKMQLIKITKKSAFSTLSCFPRQPEGQARYSMVIDLFENEEGVLMVKVSGATSSSPTHAPQNKPWSSLLIALSS